MNLFYFYLPEEIFVALSFLVLVIVLKRIFWKPIIKMIEDRQQLVSNQLQDAADAQTIINKMQKQQATQNIELEQLAIEKTKEAHEHAAQEYERIICEAREKAQAIINSGEEKAKRHYQQAIKDSKEAITSLALTATAAIVESSVDNTTNRTLINAILSRAGVGNE